MSQTPSKRWKKTISRAIVAAEHAFRDGNPRAYANSREIRNFVFLQFESPLGSVIHATPVFEALKRAVPDAHISVSASSMAAGVLESNPYISRCIVTPDPSGHFSQTVGAVRQMLQSAPPGPKCVITTIGNRRPRLAYLSLLAGKTLRVGHTAAPELYDLPLTFVPERGQIEGNLDILRALGHPVAFCEPRMFFSRQDVDWAGTWMGQSNGHSEMPRIAFITQTSGGQQTQWKRERFQQVITILGQKFNAVPVFFGTAAESLAIESLRQPLSRPGISAAGKTTIAQLAAALAQCDLAISLDTGAFHVARAVALPAVVLAPAWQDPREWLPVAHPRYRVLRGSSIKAPPSGYCMEEISVEQVIHATTELLDSFPASVDARRVRLERGTVFANRS